MGLFVNKLGTSDILPKWGANLYLKALPKRFAPATAKSDGVVLVCILHSSLLTWGRAVVFLWPNLSAKVFLNDELFWEVCFHSCQDITFLSLISRPYEYYRFSMALFVSTGRFGRNSKIINQLSFYLNKAELNYNAGYYLSNSRDKVRVFADCNLHIHFTCSYVKDNQESPLYVIFPW